ncbi:unnamed protein product [Aureobasidium uvarum]|uniref:Uncharacterized protein n=1 Tax=Aureobasidium uvarum TaxID=2773716 RepID=A0A9N8PR24_9PEZI|nr:unnamed protein product [Aureobasidium uvarum]
MNTQDEIQDLINDQEQIDLLNKNIQLNLLAELKDYQWMDDWMPAAVPEMPTPEDKTLQSEMRECAFGFPVALHLTTRNTSKRVWFTVYDDAFELTQRVLSFASTTTPQFSQFVTHSYLYWIRNGRASLWNPEMFLQRISQSTFFIWSSTPNYDMTDENTWTPAAKGYTDLYLQEILAPNDIVCFSPYPEFSILPHLAESFAQMNRNYLTPGYLGTETFMREFRKGRFLTLGLPAVSFAQVVTEQIIPSLMRAVELSVPDEMVIWAQNLDLMVIGELSQNRQPPADALASSFALRRLGTTVINNQQYNLGVTHGLIPPSITSHQTPRPPQLSSHPPWVFDTAYDGLLADIRRIQTLAAAKGTDARAALYYMLNARSL